MFRKGLVWMLLLLAACGDSDQQAETDENAFSYVKFSEQFPERTLPYQVSDTSLSRKGDTARLRAILPEILKTDSLNKVVFGKNARITYKPLFRVQGKSGEQYFGVRAVSGNKRAALLWIFRENEWKASFPLLVPDADPSTTQLAILDKSFLVNKVVTKRMPDDVAAEGKDVYAYDPATDRFSLIMTDPLDDRNLEVINPIDTLTRKHTYAGDYTKDKRNIVSVRDAGNNKEVNFFIHFEKNNGECKGEMKGTAVFTSSRTAVYKQGSCTLEMNFTSSRVSIKETGPCGAYRDIQCIYEGSFTKKRPTAKKSSKKPIS